MQKMQMSWKMSVSRNWTLDDKNLTNFEEGYGCTLLQDGVELQDGQELMSLNYLKLDLFRNWAQELKIIFLGDAQRVNNRF